MRELARAAVKMMDREGGLIQEALGLGLGWVTGRDGRLVFFLENWGEMGCIYIHCNW